MPPLGVIYFDSKSDSFRLEMLPLVLGEVTLSVPLDVSFSLW